MYYSWLANSSQAISLPTGFRLALHNRACKLRTRTHVHAETETHTVSVRERNAANRTKRKRELTWKRVGKAARHCEAMASDSSPLSFEAATLATTRALVCAARNSCVLARGFDRLLRVLWLAPSLLRVWLSPSPCETENVELVCAELLDFSNRVWRAERKRRCGSVRFVSSCRSRVRLSVALELSLWKCHPTIAIQIQLHNLQKGKL